MSAREFDDIGNYYGCLLIKRGNDGKPYWGIENYNGTDWAEITEALYSALDTFWVNGLEHPTPET